MTALGNDLTIDRKAIVAEYRQSKAEIQALTSIESAKDMRDRGATLADFLKRRGETALERNKVAATVIQIDRRIGELLPKKQQGKKNFYQPDKSLSAMEQSRCRTLASVDAKEFDSFLCDSIIADDELTRAKVLRFCKNINLNGTPDPASDDDEPAAYDVTDDILKMRTLIEKMLGKCSKRDRGRIVAFLKQKALEITNLP